MLIPIERTLPSLSVLLLALGLASAAAASCDDGTNDRQIRNAVNSGATVVISSKGTSFDRGYAVRRVRHVVAAPPPALKVSYESGSAEPDPSALKALVNRAAARHKRIEIRVIAFAADDPCRAEALAQTRAAALRDRVVELGATPSQVKTRAIGGRVGHDRAEFRLIASSHAAHAV